MVDETGGKYTGKQRQSWAAATSMSVSKRPQMKQTRLAEAELVEWRCIAGHANWQDNTFTFALRTR
jgi:hypothetical protein